MLLDSLSTYRIDIYERCRYLSQFSGLYMMQSPNSELSNAGTLRAGINLGNPLLVTGSNSSGAPRGVAPDLAAAIAECLSVDVAFRTYGSPGEVADGLERDEWDIALIAAEPKRARTIAFCGAYVEIEASYLVPEDSSLRTCEDVDQPGVQIAVSERAAYDLYLSRTLKHATLRRANGLAGALNIYVQNGLDALAGLVPALREDALTLPGSRILEGNFTTVRQAIGTSYENTVLRDFLGKFIQDAKTNGLLDRLIREHGVEGKLQVAADS